MKLVILSLFLLVCPALIINLCRRWPALDKLGSALICYGLGMLIANIGVLPEGSGPVQTMFMSISVPLALPLLLFSLDLKRWTKLAGRAFLSFSLVIVAVLIATTVSYVFYHDSVEESWKVAGMLIGVYTGGSVNLNAIGLALKAQEHVLVLTNTADMLVCTPYFLFILSYAQRVLGKILPPFCYPEKGSEAPQAAADCAGAGIEDFNDYSGIFSPAVALPLAGATLASIAIFGISYAVYGVVPVEFNMAALMISITTLGVFGSFVPKLRNIKKSFQLGQYIILVFCLVVGSLANLGQVVMSAPTILIFTAIVVYGSMLLHVLFAAIFRVDADTMIITSVAAVFSPPFVPVVAAALKNKDVIISGIATGILGWVIGNYLGISYAYLLKNLFG
ncbi:MAG: DUF819 family protein [Spirochaetes bacterium]|jgi:uncharacterized membrane protein|nr:DUF819 family protein [Spirochaetota bacterium]